MRNQTFYLALFFSLFCLGASAQSLIRISFVQPPVFTVTPQTKYTTLPVSGSIQLGEDASISGGSGSYTYIWTSEGKELGTAKTLTVDKPGNYSLVVNDGHGCTSGIMYYVTDGSSALEKTTELKMIVFPNPTEGLVSIQLKTIEGLEKITVLTPDGRTVATYSEGEYTYIDQQISLDLKDLPKGNYFISLHFDSKILTNAIILR